MRTVRTSSASALKALALTDVNQQLSFAVPAIGWDSLALCVRQDPHQPPVPAADGALEPAVCHCQQSTRDPAGLQ